MAKIVKLIESRDSKVRAANILLPTSKTINRSINLLYPLETAPAIELITMDDENELQVDDRSEVYKGKRKSPRNAAMTAQFRLKELFNDEIGTFFWCRECHES